MVRFKRTKSDCASCPLRDRPKVWAEGPENPHIAFFGEAPGAVEEAEGRPLVGPAGRYFNWGLGNADILRHREWMSNILPCKLPNNDWNSLEACEARKCCAAGFEEEIEWLKKKSCVFAPLGAQPTKAFKVGGSITNTRGSIWSSNGQTIIPTYHPSFFIRQGVGYKNFVWISDLKKIKRIAYEGYVAPKEEFILQASADELIDHMEAIPAGTLVAVDTETTSLDPYLSEIVMVGLATSSTRAVVIPFLRQGGLAVWTPDEKSRIQDALGRVFRRSRLLFQNSIYDIRQLAHHGYEIPFENLAHDTLLLHHAVSPELPHNLGFIVSIYGETPYWKSTLLGRSGSILDIPNGELRRYNARDCVVLHQVLPGLLEDVCEQGTERVYIDESLKLVEPIIAMTDAGIKLDKNKLAYARKKLNKQIEEIEDELKRLGNLPDQFNLASDEDLRLFLFGIVGRKFIRAKEKLATKSRNDTKVYRDLSAVVRVAEDTKPLYDNGRQGRKTATGKLSVNKQGLLSLQLQLQNRLEKLQHLKKAKPDEEKAINTLLTWLDRFYEYRRLQKLYSTYTSFPVGQDSRVRSNFLIHGTATGRLSSSSPNLQNIPAKDKLIRRCFVAEDGYTLLKRDYSNLEVRILAYASGDEDLIALIERGVNIHDENVRILFPEVDEKHKKYDLTRRAAKIFQFGRIQYGGSDREIYEKIILEVPKLGLTFAGFKQAVRRWFEHYRTLAEYQERLRSDVLSTRRVSNAFGRVRTLMGSDVDIVKEGLNFPIQSTAASIINRAMIDMYQWMKKSGTKARLVLQIHDELILEVPNEDLKRVDARLKKYMEQKHHLWNRDVSFPTEKSVTTTWGDL